MQGPYRCSKEQFEQLLSLLAKRGYKLLGPTIQDKTIVLEEIHSSQDLPIGWMDEQEPGYYQLKKRDDLAYFGYNLGPHSWKKYLFPPEEKLFSAHKQANGLVVFQETLPPIEKKAFIGVRACEIKAISILDHVFASHTHYQRRRADIFILAVNCTRSVSTCFCVSMQAGPCAKEGYDIALTEVIQSDDQYFLLTTGSSLGRELTLELSLTPASQQEEETALDLIEKNKQSQQRSVDYDHVHDHLLQGLEAKRWDTVAKRCVNCANCTLACPTCFCSHIEEKVSLEGVESERWQKWDSCFTLSHSLLHTGSVRHSAKSRYRQWLTHKFGTWWEQFGESGCVGCGRCITWCPVGIDVTEELSALKEEKP